MRGCNQMSGVILWCTDRDGVRFYEAILGAVLMASHVCLNGSSFAPNRYYFCLNDNIQKT